MHKTKQLHYLVLWCLVIRKLCIQMQITDQYKKDWHWFVANGKRQQRILLLSHLPTRALRSINFMVGNQFNALKYKFVSMQTIIISQLNLFMVICNLKFLKEIIKLSRIPVLRLRA